MWDAHQKDEHEANTMTGKYYLKASSKTVLNHVTVQFNRMQLCHRHLEQSGMEPPLIGHRS